MSKEKLAIDGGTPVITEGIPGGMHGPSVIDQQEIDAVAAVLKSQKLFRFCEDSKVEAFEKEATEFFGVKYTLMVNSGTSALDTTVIYILSAMWKTTCQRWQKVL